MYRVFFRKENLDVHVRSGTNLRRACLDHGVDPYPALGGLLSCRGKGFCGTCRVRVDDAQALSPPSPREARYLKRHGPSQEGRLRLSCQAEVRADVAVDTDPDQGPPWKRHPFYAGGSAHSWERTGA